MSLKIVSNEEQFMQIYKSTSLAVVHFVADWAPQCKQIDDVLLELKKQNELENIIFAKIVAEEVAEVSQKFEITAVPTVLLVRDGKVVDRVDGVNVADLVTKIKAQASKSLLLSSEVPVKKSINERLKQLVNTSKCMIFMKGSPDQPKCGFSRTLIELLTKHSADYKFFDILTDDEVRQGLKKYSDWPTYPQVYVDGELLGGLDILKDMDASGDLQNSLPKKVSLEDRLKSLINKSELMIFMKGSPEEPRCGFSKQLIQILGETGLKYETFDILSDEEVRQGLKTFSEWPTYPQIYVKGELIGGLDILKEMKSDGSLLSALKGN